MPTPQHDADHGSAPPNSARPASIPALLSTEEVAAWCCPRPQTILSRDGDARLISRPDAVWARPAMQAAAIRAVRAEESASVREDATDEEHGDEAGARLDAGERA